MKKRNIPFISKRSQRKIANRQKDRTGQVNQINKYNWTRQIQTFLPQKFTTSHSQNQHKQPRSSSNNRVQTQLGRIGDNRSTNRNSSTRLPSARRRRSTRATAGRRAARRTTTRRPTIRGSTSRNTSSSGRRSRRHNSRTCARSGRFLSMRGTVEVTRVVLTLVERGVIVDGEGQLLLSAAG